MKLIYRRVLTIFPIALLSGLLFSPALSECYSYDNLGRLTSVVYDNANSAKRTYNLDLHGNRTTVIDQTSGGSTCSPPSGNASQGENDPGGGTGGGGSNTPPVADDDNYGMELNSTLTANPLEGDTDSEGGILSLVSISGSSPYFTAQQSGNSVILTTGNLEGTGSISYVVSDDNGETDTGTMTVDVTDTGLPSWEPPACEVSQDPSEIINCQ